MGTLHGQMGTLHGQMGTLHGQMGTLREQMGTLREGIIPRLERLETQTRHNGVEIEHMRGQIQLISEVVSGLDSRLTAFQGHTTKDLADLRGLVTTGFSMINDRVRSLELWRESLEPRSRPLISDQ
jgi:hypothetical protein